MALELLCLGRHSEQLEYLLTISYTMYSSYFPNLDQASRDYNKLAIPFISNCRRDVKIMPMRKIKLIHLQCYLEKLNIYSQITLPNLQ